MMSHRLPIRVEARFRQHAPRGVRVLAGSTPVVSFGDLRKAWVATLAINPSFGEFLHSNGHEREGVDEQRLETLRSLRCANLARASREAIQCAFTSCNTYFARHPYGYFTRLERILKHLGASFYKGSACHLDLVQWATKPLWKELEPSEREALLQADVPFLKSQLSRKHLEVVIINGAGVRKEYERFLGVRLADVNLRRQAALNLPRGQYVKFFEGASQGQIVVGWNVNLQGTHGISDETVEAIGKKIANMISKARH
jgi:hypothetical protein